MRVGDTDDITALLRSLPDMKPPDDAWQRIRAAQPRRYPFVWAAAALAACAALVALALGTTNPPIGPEPGPPAETYLVSSSPVQSARQAEPVHVDELRRRSRHMERMLLGLPPRTHLVRADMEGAIAELQDRIAAVDYELNRGLDSRASSPSGTVRRWPAVRPATSRDLWRQRVELMDRLVRVRYAEAGAEAY